MGVQKKKPSEVLTKVVEMLTPLSCEERQRIVTAALAFFGEAPVSEKQVRHEGAGGEENTNLPTRAQTWIKQNGIKMEDLQQVFHFAENGVDVIAAEIPGKNKKDKTHAAYILHGIAQLLATGDPRFDDKSARALCTKLGCYDNTNHAWIMKGIGNAITGSKAKGWAVTAPGLKRGAELIKALSSTN